MAMRAPAPTSSSTAERQNAVILLAELRNFTRMSEMLEPQQVLGLASRFFTLAAREVAEHGGETFEVYNDALLAVFRHDSASYQAEQAVKAAHGILVDFAGLAESWQEEFGLRTAVALALHHGETVFGLAGPQGMERPLAFGDSLSVADRLLHRARAGEFVFSDAMMAALAASDLDLDAEPLPPLELARRAPIKIYGVLLDTRLDFT
jgi:adenylate cyclase